MIQETRHPRIPAPSQDTKAVSTNNIPKNWGLMKKSTSVEGLEMRIMVETRCPDLSPPLFELQEAVLDSYGEFVRARGGELPSNAAGSVGGGKEQYATDGGGGGAVQAQHRDQRRTDDYFVA